MLCAVEEGVTAYKKSRAVPLRASLPFIQDPVTDSPPDFKAKDSECLFSAELASVTQGVSLLMGPPELQQLSLCLLINLASNLKVMSNYPCFHKYFPESTHHIGKQRE